MKLIGVSAATLVLIASFVFAIVMAVLINTDAVNVWLAIILTVVINLVLWLVGPWLTDWINRFFYKVRFLTPEELQQYYPHLASLITEVSQAHRFPVPKVGVIADDNPTAFTYGSGRYNARVIFTNGITKYLNIDEQRAVIAHEMGHVVNRDFVVMMVASTMVQILYEAYAALTRSIGKSRGRNNLAIIGLASYVLYVIASYLLLFLSRTRELMADEFSARITEPEDLSNALIKIAYGIVSEQDTATTTRLLKSTRHMGLADVKNAKHAGGVSYITNNDDAAVTEAMLFDAYNPWARLVELNSTHPLTGRRIQRLSTLPTRSGRQFRFDVDTAAARIMLNSRRMWNNLFRDLVMLALPVILAIAGFVFMAAKSDGYEPFGVAMIGFGVGSIATVLYRFPMTSSRQTTVLQEMRNPYASPVRGEKIGLEGQVVGRGMAGYVFSEDMMYQDKSGLIFVNYTSLFGWIGNLIFALARLKKLVGTAANAEGWYTRSIASQLTLSRLQLQEGKMVRSYPRLWQLAMGVVVCVAGTAIVYVETAGVLAGVK